MMSSGLGNGRVGAVTNPVLRRARGLLWFRGLIAGLAGLSGLAAPVGCGDSGDGESDGETSSAASTTSTTMATTSSTDTSATTTTSTTDGTESTGSESGTGADGESSSESGGGGLVVLQNDSWTPADGLIWETWANVDDCWASSYDIDAGLYPLELVSIQVAIGGSEPEGSATQPFDVRIYSVDAMGAPDQLIDSVEVDVMGNAAMVPEIVLADVGLMVPPIDSGSFAVAMCHVGHMGAPSIGIDDDGTVDPARNWVWQDIMGGWVAAPDFFGIGGDFILRAVVQSGG